MQMMMMNLSTIDVFHIIDYTIILSQDELIFRSSDSQFAVSSVLRCLPLHLLLLQVISFIIQVSTFANSCRPWCFIFCCCCCCISSSSAPEPCSLFVSASAVSPCHIFHNPSFHFWQLILSLMFHNSAAAAVSPHLLSLNSLPALNLAPSQLHQLI